jgi:hypothetical protein
MKTLDWFGFFAPRRDATQDRGKLRRLVDLMTRGATPVDGLDIPAKERELERNPEPVRWGNFR